MYSKAYGCQFQHTKISGTKEALVNTTAVNKIHGVRRMAQHTHIMGRSLYTALLADQKIKWNAVKWRVNIWSVHCKMFYIAVKQRTSDKNVKTKSWLKRPFGDETALHSYGDEQQRIEVHGAAKSTDQ